MKRISVIALYILNILILCWWQVRSLLENGESGFRMGGIITIIVMATLSLGLWYKPRVFRWISLGLSLIWMTVLTVQFYYILDFLKNQDPIGDALRMTISASISLCLSMAIFILLLLPEKFGDKSKEK